MSNVSLNLNRIVEIKRSEHGSINIDEIELLHISMQSIAKRVDYCKYHYQEFLRNSCDLALLQERLDSKAKSIRIIYEASAVAFLQNLHSLIDSYPYALNLINRECKDINSTSIGWNKDFINKHQRFSYYSELESIFNNTFYHKLKGLVNRAKHKHLVRIENTGGTLIFEDFPYYSDGNSFIAVGQDVNEFLVECYDDLLPEFLMLCNSVEKYKENEVNIVRS